MQNPQYISLSDKPKCCDSCKHFDWDSKDEYSPSYGYCLKGVFIPVSKQECKRYQHYKEPTQC